MAKQVHNEVRFSSRAEEEAAAIALAERLGLPYVDLASFRVDPELFRSIPVEWMLRYGFVPESKNGQVDDGDLRRPGRRRPPRRARVARRAAPAHQGRQPRRHQRHPAEERVVAARPRRGDRGLPDAARLRGRGGRRDPHDGPDHAGRLADHQARRFGRLQRHPAPGLRHPHRDAGKRRPHQVPHRRRAVPGDGSDRQTTPRDDHFAHQGHVGARHRRKARAAGRPLQAAGARSHDRFPRVDHADRARGRLGHSHPGQGVGQRRVQEPEPRGRGLRRRDEEEAAQVHSRAVRHGPRDGPDGLGQDDHALRLPLGDPVGRGQDRHDRGPGRISAPGNHADPGQREEGPDVRARAALDPPPRPRQDHGRRDPRRGDGADRRAIGPHRPPRVHDRAREQRRRRSGPLPEHEGRAVQLRLGPELRARPASRPEDLHALQGEDDGGRRSVARGGPRSGRDGRAGRSTRARVASNATARASTAGWRSRRSSTSRTASAG